MKLLVTGGAGFIGANFILYWLKQYPTDTVVNLDKLTYAGNLENLSSVTSVNYSFIHGDICDVKLVDSVMDGIDTVVHFAAESHVDRSIEEPAIFLRTNIIGTQILLDAAFRKKIKRFHHISTDEVFGTLQLGSTEKFSEDSVYNPRSPYAASKAAADHMVRVYWTSYGLPVTITNCSNNFGPFQHPEKFIPLTITNCIEGKKIPVYGNGKNVRDWLYVDDHCRAIDAVIRRGKIGETYCIGGMSHDISNLDVVKKILAEVNGNESMIEYVPDRPGHDLRYALNWGKIHKELGWKPQHDFDTWLTKTVAWYKKNSSWWQKIKKGEFQSYYKKQYKND